VTLYLNLRQLTVGGYVAAQPYMLQGDGETPASLTAVVWNQIAPAIAGRNILFYIHGFNVNFNYGARCFQRLVPLLNLQGSDIAIGVLWPGDSWLPGIDYPIEGGVAITSGNAIAKFCRDYLATARSFSFASHSLGARVVLQALLGLDRPARSVTLTAPAINQNCLTEEYANAVEAKITDLSVLASRGDNVLKLAFPPGDAGADLLHDDHPFGEPALGYAGPSAGEAALVDGPWQIPYTQGGAYPPNYDHGNYHPPGDIPAPPPGPSTYATVATYISNAFYGRAQNWPAPAMPLAGHYVRYPT
jgi:hypothetical protein